jgi:hypothetical protein
MGECRPTAGKTVASITVVACAVLAIHTAAWGATSSPVVDVSVVPTRAWTDTGVDVHRGDAVTITATGFVRFGKPPIDRVAPAGIVWGPRCFLNVAPDQPWTSIGLPCYSLLARVDAGPPREVGHQRTLTMEASGRLFLGANDNIRGDNSGGWTAHLTVVSAVVHHSSRAWLLLLALGIVIVLLGVLFWKLGTARQPEFEQAPTLRAGRAKVRVAPDGSVWRRDDANNETAFVVEPGDFVETPLARPRASFSCFGLRFHIVRSRVPFGRARAEVQRVGQFVTAAGGYVMGPDGFTIGRVPVSLRHAWAFALTAVEPNDDGQASAIGELAMFVRVDRPFELQTDAITTSFAEFTAHVDQFITRRAPTVASPHLA